MTIATKKKVKNKENERKHPLKKRKRNMEKESDKMKE